MPSPARSDSPGGVAGEEADRGLGARVPARQGRALQRGPAGHGDHRAPGRERRQQRLARPVEGVLDVHLPGLAERLPGVLVQWAGQRGRTGVEDEDPRPVGVDEVAGRVRVGDVGDHGSERVAQLGVQARERVAVPGDPHDARSGRAEGFGDRAPEAPASPGDQRGRAGYLRSCHDDPPSGGWTAACQRPAYTDQPARAKSPGQLDDSSAGRPKGPARRSSRNVTIREIPAAVTVRIVIAWKANTPVGWRR